MINLEQIKITRRDQQLPKLLVAGCSNKEIAAELKVSPCTAQATLAHSVLERRNCRPANS